MSIAILNIECYLQGLGNVEEVRARDREAWDDKVFCHGKADALELTEAGVAAQDLSKHSRTE